MVGYDRHSETERVFVNNEDLTSQSLYKIQSNPDSKDQVNIFQKIKEMFSKIFDKTIQC